MNNYFDKMGRLHTKPMKASGDYPTNNAWIYTAIYKTLQMMNDKNIGDVNVQEAMSLCKVKEGVYSRHPVPYATQPNMVPVSHDEIIGISMLSYKAALGIAKKSSDDAYFCDIVGYERKPDSSLFQKIHAWILYLYRIIIKKENERRITKDYPALFGVFFTHRRQYRYIYESMAMHNRSLFNGICWASARLLDSITNSVSLMHYMATIRMGQALNSSVLFNFVLKQMNRSILRKYGPRPIDKLIEEYLLNGTGSLDQDHPWLVEIRLYYKNKGE